MAPERSRGPKDRKEIDVTDPHELLIHAQRMRVTPQAIALAVARVGANADEVAAFLGI